MVSHLIIYLVYNTGVSNPSQLQGTLTKHTKPTLKPNFAKEPFRPSRLKESLIVEIYRQCLTAGKVHRLCCAPGIGTQADFLYLSK
jgi:hypothetical protein